MSKVWTVKAIKNSKKGSVKLLEGYEGWFSALNMEDQDTDSFYSSYFNGIPTNQMFEFKVVQISNGYRIQMPAIEKEEVAEDHSFDGWEELEGTWFAPEELETIGVIDNIITTGNFANVQLIGPSGLGKTQRAMSWAKHANLNFCKVTCGGIMTPKDWFMTREVQQGETIDKKTVFSDHLRQGNSLILLDELNRTSPMMHGPLYPVLDDTREVHIMHERFPLGEKIIFVATINNGLGHVGTQSLDKALENRFNIKLEATYPPFWVEVDILTSRTGIDQEKAMQIISKFDLMREENLISEVVDVTTRPALGIANLVVNGMSMYNAFKVCLVNGTEYEVGKAISDIVTGL